MQVASLSICDIGVRSPDLIQKLPVHGELLEPGAVVSEPGIRPILPEVAIQCEDLLVLIHWTHGANSHVHLNFQRHAAQAGADLTIVAVGEQGVKNA